MELSVRADIQLAETQGGPHLALVNIDRIGPAVDHPHLDASLLALATGWVIADPKSTADPLLSARTLASVAAYDEPPNHLADLPPALVSDVAPELLRYVRNFHIEVSVSAQATLPSITVTPSGFDGRRPKTTDRWIDPRTGKWKQRTVRLTHRDDLERRTTKLPDVLYRWLLVNTHDPSTMSHLNLLVKSLVDRVNANELTAENYLPVCCALVEREFPNSLAGPKAHDLSRDLAPSLRDMTEDERQALQRLLSAAQDEVLAEAIQADGVLAAEWQDDTMELFGQFMRTLLTEAMHAHEAYRDCGATHDELPYVLVLAGLRPALEKSGEATQKLGASSEDPMKALVSLADPIQAAVDRRVRPNVFDAVQKRIHPELPS